MILSYVFGTQSDGFYIDVGAHDPVRFSNTYCFYLRGWCGINIDATPGSMKPFNIIRPRDTNLERAISENPCKLTFHIFNEPALNTFDAALAKERDGISHFRLLETREIETQTLSRVLSEAVFERKIIDFMSVDVEGLDLSVLRSNDWEQFSPTYVLTEEFFAENIERALRSPTATFMRSVGYVLFAKTAHTLIFKKTAA